MGEIDDSELICNPDNSDQAILKFLRGDYSRLVHTTAEKSAKLDSMAEMLLEVKNTLSQLCNQLGIHPIEAESSNQTPPVTFSDSSVRDSLRLVHTTDEHMEKFDSIEALLREMKQPPSIEMPEFDASNVSDWLSRVERFFSVRRYSDLTKLDLVAFSLEGDVLLWFDREMTRREFQSWDEFRRRLLLQFGAAPENSENVAELLEERASHTEKKGTVSASVTASAELSSQMIGLDESHLEQLLSKGLQTEMKEVLQLQEPMGLDNQTPAVLRMGTFTSKPVASVHFLSFEVGTADNLFCGLSQTSQVWEPGGVQELPNQAKILNDGDVISSGTGSSTYRLSSIPLVFYFCPSSEIFKMDQSVYAASSSSGVLERTVSHEWHRWKHKTAYLQGLLEFVFPWNLMLLEFFLFIHLEDKVCLSGASNRWCGWQVFDRGKDVQTDLWTVKDDQREMFLLEKARDAQVDSLIVRIKIILSCGAALGKQMQWAEIQKPSLMYKELWFENNVGINTGVSELKWIIWGVSSNLVEAAKVNVNSEIRHGVCIILVLKREPKLEGNHGMRGLLGISMSCFGDIGSVLVMVLYFNLDGKMWYTKRQQTSSSIWHRWRRKD